MNCCRWKRIALDRLRLSGTLSDPKLEACWTELAVYLAAMETVPLTSAVLRRAAGPLPTPLGALDAIHLATALIWMDANSQELILLTHDRQLALCAQACGVPIDPELGRPVRQ